jgi:hypothetical protein
MGNPINIGTLSATILGGLHRSRAGAGSFGRLGENASERRKERRVIESGEAAKGWNTCSPGRGGERKGNEVASRPLSAELGFV